MRIFYEIRGRLPLVLVVMACLVIATAAISLVAFRSVDSSFSEISDKRIPEVKAISELLVDTEHMLETIEHVTLASTREQIDTSYAEFTNAIALTRGHSELIDPVEIADVLKLLTGLEADVDRLQRTRHDELDASELISGQLADLRSIEQEVRSVLGPRRARAEEAMSQGVVSAREKIDSTLSTLVERDFGNLEVFLQIRAQVNLLTGVAIAQSLSSDPSLNAVLSDLGESAFALTTELVAGISYEGWPAEGSAAIEGMLAAYESGSAGDLSSRRTTVERMLRTRQEVDAALSEALDNLLFDLTISTEDASTLNAETLQSFIDNDLKTLQEAMSLETSLAKLITGATRVAIATDQATLDTDQRELNAMWFAMTTFGSSVGDELEELMDRFGAIISAETGISVARSAQLNAVKSSHDAAIAASRTISSVAKRASEMEHKALSRISQSGEAVKADIRNAQMGVYGFTGIALIVTILAILAAQRLITAPMAALTKATERLSAGDMAPITGYDQRRDEIGSMGRALSVFRNNALRVEEMRRESEIRDEEEQEKRRAMFQTLADEIGVVVSSASRGDFATRVGHVFEDREIASLAEDVNNLMDTTEKGLDAVRGALHSLSNADLTARMTGDFSGIFADLQGDVNTTVSKLSEIVGEIRTAANDSSAHASALTTGADGLARRTESQAAALEETAAAMEEMSSSVRSNVAQLREAEQLSTQVAERTDGGEKAAQAAIEKVERIASSSEKITDIVATIESISFQTNLLALNAAVEAARAGSQGKGFAVVASEVRQLAKRSAEAAGEISELVAESTANVESGVRTVEQTGEALAKIGAAVHPLLASLSEISRAGKEQATGIEEVNQSVSHMDQMTQENSALADETKRGAMQLTDEIDGLANTVAAFKLKEDAVTSSSVSFEPPEGLRASA